MKKYYIQRNSSKWHTRLLAGNNAKMGPMEPCLSSIENKKQERSYQLKIICPVEMSCKGKMKSFKHSLKKMHCQ